jgi:hypothetical protein
MNSMGFRTPANVPYKIIGDPLYLDHKSIVLYGLGQLKDAAPVERNFIKQSVNLIKSQSELIGKNQKPTSNLYALHQKSKAKNKNLINLTAEVNKTKDLMRRVQLGQSLFGILADDQVKKTQKLISDKQKSLTDMQLRPMEEEEWDEADDGLLIKDEEDEGNYTEMRYLDNNSPGFNSVYTNDYQQIEGNNTARNCQQQRQLTNASISMPRQDTQFDIKTETESVVNANDSSTRPHTYPAQHLHM